MSRRREAADLARALLLSTQEATAVSGLSPHTLSSSKSGSQDSKEMELRAYEVGGGVAVKMPPTVRPADIMGPPESAGSSGLSSGRGRPSRSDPMSGSTSNGVPPSDIQSFTPSHSLDRAVAVPATDPLPPRSLSTNPQFSSPIFPPPASRPSTTNKSLNSSDSSHRPLFSPTQTSAISVTDPRARLTTYSKRSASPLKSRTQIPPDAPLYVLSSSPPSESGPVHPLTPKRKVVATSSDNEVEEQIEIPRSRSKSSKVEIVLSSREKGTKHRSPDPLDSLSSRSSPKSSAPIPRDTSPPLSVSPLVARDTASSSAAPTTQHSVDDNVFGPSRRVSSRVQVIAAKATADKAERRRKRALEKEQKAKAEAAKVAGGQAEPSSRARNSGMERRSLRGEQADYTANAAEQLDDVDKGRTRTGKQRGKSRPTEEPTLEVDFDYLEKTHGPKKQVSFSRSIGERARGPPKEAEKHAEKGRKRKVDQEESEADDLQSWDEEEVSKRVSTKSKAKAASRTAKSKKRSPVKKVVKVVEPAPAPAPVEASVIEEDEEEEPEQQKPKAVLQKDATITPIPSLEKLPPPRRSPLKPTSSNLVEPPHRPSPGPSNRPGGIKWKTARSDLTTVLSKFQGTKSTGMSRRLRIAPLHAKIGPPVKALPPVPLKPVRKKKGDSDEEDEEEESVGEEESDGEGGVRKVKKGKGRGIEWFMVED